MDVGVNLWGSDYQENGQYLFPTESEIDYFAAKGFTNIRLSFSWETIQPKLNGPLDANYVALIEKTVEYAKSQGLDVILDVHNYGAYNGDLIGSNNVPVSSFADLWGKIASAFVDDSNVRFGLMNEPQLATAADWLKAANSAIAAIRDAGADQEVLVPGAYWTGAWSWTESDNAKVLGAPGAIVDPAHNFAFEVHQYLDDTSGQNSWVVSETIGVERLTEITDWARAAGAKLYLGEFGVADNAKALAALDNMMSYISKNDDVWQSVSYWVAGQANPSYMYQIEPDFGLFDAPQMDVLEKYASAQTQETHMSDGSVRLDYYVDGRDMPSMSDVVSKDGVLISRTLFDADGNERSQATVAADGGVTVTSYSDPGSSFPFERDVYDADHHLLVQTVADNSGAETIKYFHAGDHDPYRTEGYNSDGSHSYTQEFGANGVTATNYVNNVVVNVEHYGASWQFLGRDSYDAQGHHTQSQTDNADGSHTIALYNTQTGNIYNTTVYSSAWNVTSVTSYDGNENPVTRSTTLANGNREIEYFVNGQDVPDHTDTLTADSKLISRITYHADNYVTDTYVTPGSTKLAQSTTSNLDGTVTALTRFDANGLIQFVQHYNADGSYSQDNYSAASQQHPASSDLFGADDKLISHTEFAADGHATSTDTVSGDGRQTVEYFAAGTDNLSKIEVFDASGKLLARTTYDDNNHVSLIQKYNADGSHTLETYTADHQQHPVTIGTYNADNILVRSTELDGDGNVISIDTLGADGSHSIAHFIAGSDMASTLEVLSPTGVLEMRVSYDASGLVSSILHENADGTHSVENFSADNQAHAAFTDVYDASWSIMSRTQFDANGNVTAIDKIEADGSHTVQYFNATSHVTTSEETYTGDWKLETRTNYDASGMITTIAHDNSDGTHTVETYGASSQAHPAYTDQFDAGWTIVSRTQFDASGNITGIDTIEADGSHAVQNFVAGSGKLSSLETYTANWQLEERTNFDLNGLVTTISLENADGTHTVQNYTADVQDHATSTDRYDANWSLVSREYFNDKTLTAHIEAKVEVADGVDVAGTGDTVLTNKGTVAGDDFAIQDSAGTLTLVNRGTIRGDVDLGSGDDVFDVRAGTFSGTVDGGAGDDTFKVSSSDTQISERANGGNDTVVSTASFELGDAIEDLKLAGKQKIVGQGNDLDNQLIGNGHSNRLFGWGGDDTLWGGAGRDVLFGGDGSDTFELRAHSGREVVRDFQDGIDKISVWSADAIDITDLLEHHMRQRGDDVVIDHGSDRMILDHMQISQITAADFILT